MQAVKWGEYRLGDLFDVLSYKQRFDANKVTLVENGGHPYIVRQGSDNGQKGFIDEDEIYLNDGNTISFGQDTATMFYQEKPYFTGDKIKILKPKMERFGKDNVQFFLATMRRSFSNFGWGTSSFSIEVIENQNITLPTTTNNEIDFDFMESFIRELEEERIRELQSYLAVTGLSDYTLTLSEQDALKGFETLEWREFNVTDVFNVKNTHNILSSEIAENSGGVPYLCASAENNGVSSYISYNADFLEDGNCIFIGGKTFVVSYQKYDFFSNDSHNLALYLKDCEADKSNQLYLATCIRKSLAHKYSWGNSISNAKIKGDKVMLPVRDGVPDYEAMQDFISAVQKLVIKDVVQYADKKIGATKKVLKSKTEYKIDDENHYLRVAESADYKCSPR